MRLYCENIDFSYEQNHILKNLSVAIPDNEITVIIGPNGCGKSTLLKSLTRIIKDYKGNIILDGKNILRENTKTLAQKMAILPQIPESQIGITVRELVSYGRFPYQKALQGKSKKDIEIVDWAMKVTDVNNFSNRSLEELSGGQKQRVWISMALAQETDIIFLDEPTTYLDIAHQLEVLELLKTLNKKEKRTIVMVLHDINQAARFAHYIIAMKDGKIIKKGSPKEVVTKEVLREIYNIEAIIGEDPISKTPVCLTYNLLQEGES